MARYYEIEMIRDTTTPSIPRVMEVAVCRKNHSSACNLRSYLYKHKPIEKSIYFYFFLEINDNMLNWIEINSRFLSFYARSSQYEIARHLEVSQPTVSEWATGKVHVPWERLKKLVAAEQISWNWLLLGREPKKRIAALETDATESGVFNTPGINGRFLSLFQEMTQKELAAYFEVSQPAISGWKTFDRQVPWAKLITVAHEKRLSWEWLLEGIPPIGL